MEPDQLENFRIKSSVSVNLVRQMVDSWLPAELPQTSPAGKQTHSSANIPATKTPQLYNKFPGESVGKKKLQSRITIKKKEAAVEREIMRITREGADDSRTTAILAEQKSVHASKERIHDGRHKKLGSKSMLEKYLNRKKK
ncbi:hypothetical protein HDU83_004361 [Entophlyctis luteolus]|nr:hypothetical protein HDU83_004361 [Entophlyctis luteolus]KAJ3394772.1 hypothetical protein HDU84_006915 [Entophlyctis sp. JEL0112]